MVRKILRALGIILGLFVLSAFITYLIYNEKEPTGIEGPESEALTDKMFDALNKPAWDTTRYVSWTFAGMHNYLWNKDVHLVQVEWDDYRVILDHDNRTGEAWENGNVVEGDQKEELVQEAWEMFVNDSFWFIAPFKARDPGTKRALVTLENGDKALKVSYTSGGVTPGDAYLWILDESGRPKAWKLFVQVIPIGGIRYGWDEWQQISTGAWVSGLHKGLIDLDISNIKAGQTLQELGIEIDPFN